MVAIAGQCELAFRQVPRYTVSVLNRLSIICWNYSGVGVSGLCGFCTDPLDCSVGWVIDNNAKNIIYRQVRHAEQLILEGGYYWMIRNAFRRESKVNPAMSSPRLPFSTVSK